MGVFMQQNQCQKCGHCWYPRFPQRSPNCPRCNTKNWDNPNKLNQKYNFHLQGVGEDKTYPWPDTLEKRVKMCRALDAYGRLNNKKFSRQSTPQGLFVRRIS